MYMLIRVVLVTIVAVALMAGFLLLVGRETLNRRTNPNQYLAEANSRLKNEQIPLKFDSVSIADNDFEVYFGEAKTKADDAIVALTNSGLTVAVDTAHYRVMERKVTDRDHGVFLFLCPVSSETTLVGLVDIEHKSERPYKLDELIERGQRLRGRQSERR